MLRPMPPRMLGPYEILAVIGRGGASTVYRARGPRRDEVALKLLAPPPACEPNAARRLAREFEALSELDHPNVVRVLGSGVHDGYSFLAMELVEGLDLRAYLSPVLDDELAGELGAELEPGEAARGGSLGFDAWSDEPDTGTLFTGCEGPGALRAFAELLDEPATEDGEPRPRRPESACPADAPGLADARPLSPSVAARLNGPGRMARLRDALRQVCAGLAYVHERGLVHRDLKPTNIMVDDERRVRLMDFGLVKLLDDAPPLTLHGRVVGTYRYMAPEQARGEAVDHRADLYSLGVVLFELLTGRPPFTARTAPALWNEIVARSAPPVLSVNPGADARLAAVAARLLAKDPGARFQHAWEVGESM